MSIFEHPDVVPAAPTWRCPHCRTLQPETSRCRACSRATLTCSTCQLFRASVASHLGYCASDRARRPLSGEEVRSCWAAAHRFDDASGLFSDLEVVASPGPQPPSTVPLPTPAAPAVEELPLPAWRPITRPGGLVEAPRVAPGREPMSELGRRSRTSRRG